MADSEREGTQFIPAETDDVTSKDYEKAYSDLQAFLKVDIQQIQTLDDLSDKASFVCDAVRKIVIGAGEIYEKELTKYDPETGTRYKTGVEKYWIIYKPVGDHEIFATADRKSGQIRDHYGHGVEKNGVFFPAKPFKDVPNPDEFFKPSSEQGDKTGRTFDTSGFLFYAFEMRGEEPIIYSPAKERTNPVVQQGYARVLQTGIRDVLAVVPQPSEPPLPRIER